MKEYNQYGLESASEDLQQILLKIKDRYCTKCGSKMRYMAGGTYHCMECGNDELDDFGKVKKFLEDYPGSPMSLVASMTGVDEAMIQLYLKKCKIEITNDSKFFLKCEICGTDIRCGRICPECARASTEQLKGIYVDEVGECPTNPNMRGKMHFLGKHK